MKREYTFPRKIPIQALKPTKIEYLIVDIKEENPAIKFMVPGKEIFLSTKINVIEESRGIHTTSHLKYLIIRVSNLLYKLNKLTNTPEPIKP